MGTSRHGRARFRYAADPLCLAAVAMYWINRVWIKPSVWGHRGFFHDYLNDVLLVPVFLPTVLWLHRMLRLRPHDRMPSLFEIFFHVLMWSACFLVVFPHQPWLFQHSTLDPMNAAAYAAGGLASWGIWHARVFGRSGAAVRANDF